MKNRSVFEESRDIFSTPCGIIEFLRDTKAGSQFPIKQDLSWKELGSVLCGNGLATRSPSPTAHQTAWERLRASAEFHALRDEYPWLVQDLVIDEGEGKEEDNEIAVDEKLIRICFLISRELGESVLTQKERHLFDAHVMKRFGHVSAVEPDSACLELFPLLRLVDEICRSGSNNQIVECLGKAGVVDQTQASFFYQPRVRKLVRDAFHDLRPSLSFADDPALLTVVVVDDGERKNFDLDYDKCSDLLTLPSYGDMDQQRQRALLINAQRVVSRPVGRGALHLFSASEEEPQTSLQQAINLNGKFPTVGVVSLDLSLFPLDALFWPEFHNGVAVSIALGKAHTREDVLFEKSIAEAIASGKKKIFGITPELVPLAMHRHAGFLFSLALFSTLPLRLDDVYNYLKLHNEPLSMAVILGMGISARFSQDERIAKLALLHTSNEDVEIPPLVQSAALASLGFVFASSGSRSVTEVLLKEMKRKPVNERESLIFSSGFAIGLVNLGKGLAFIADSLLALIDGSGAKNSSSGSGLDLNSSSARVSLVYEALDVNLATTLAGACLGLSLAFLGSGDQVVCDRIKIPSTYDQLMEKEARCDSIFFKMLAKCLIMLPLVEPSLTWLESQLPAFLRDPLSLEHRETRTAGAETPSLIDWAAVYQARMFAIAALALSIGIKFAGSNNEQAKTVIKKILKSFINSTQWPSMHCAAQAASRPCPSLALDRATVETCRASALLSLACVAAGSGEEESVKLANQLKSASDEATPYGVNLAISMALGFICLGQCKRTFSNSQFATACLLVSVLPRFPSGVSDNRASLQLFRHLYVLATENRNVQVFDLATMAPTCQVPAKIFLSHGKACIDITLPTTLPRKTDFTHIQIRSDRYEPLTVSSSDLKDRIVLSRIPGKSAHATDPFGNLNADNAYISEFSQPADSEVRKLLSLPLGAPDEHNLDWIAFQENNLHPTTRRDWRPSVAELAAVTWPRKNLAAKYREMVECKRLLANVEPFELSLAEKYAELLLPDAEKSDNSRPEFIRIMDKCVKDQRLDMYLDLIEFRNSQS